MVSEELKGMLAAAYERLKYLGEAQDATPEEKEQLAILKAMAYGAERRPIAG